MLLRELTIQNAYIELKRDKNGKVYFFVLDRDTDQAYFVFPEWVKVWNDLVIKWSVAKEIWIKFNEKRKVVALKILKSYPRFSRQL